MKTWQAVLIAVVVPFGSLLLIWHLWRERRWQRTYSDRIDRLHKVLTGRDRSADEGSIAGSAATTVRRPVYVSSRGSE